MMKLCVALDFDGVIVDTVELLYDIYANVLRRWSLAGSSEEFQTLNGLNMTEIVDYIKAEHKLNVTHNELKDIYSGEINKMYENAALNQGIAELLNFLRSKHIQIALVSSGTLSNIDMVLTKFGLKGFFSAIISGDDVKKAKPSTEIYELLKTKMPDYAFVAVEDSLNGIVSAKEAGMSVVYYNKKRDHNSQCAEAAHYIINDFGKLGVIVYSIEKQSYSVSRINSGAVLSLNSSTVEFGKELEQLLDSLWSEALNQNERLFNGSIACYASFEAIQETVSLKVFKSDYKHFRYKEKVFAQSGIRITPLAVSGIIIDSQGNTLIGTRDNVTQYDGWVELIPSGSIQFNDNGEITTPQEQIMIELHEEANIESKLVQRIEAFCLVFDKKDEVYDIGFKIFINNDLIKLLSNGIINSSEYKNIQIVNASMLAKNVFDYRIAPTSAALLCHL